MPIDIARYRLSLIINVLEMLPSQNSKSTKNMNVTQKEKTRSDVPEVRSFLTAHMTPFVLTNDILAFVSVSFTLFFIITDIVAWVKRVAGKDSNEQGKVIWCQ